MLTIHCGLLCVCVCFVLFCFEQIRFLLGLVFLPWVFLFMDVLSLKGLSLSRYSDLSLNDIFFSGQIQSNIAIPSSSTQLLYHCLVSLFFTYLSIYFESTLLPNNTDKNRCFAYLLRTVLGPQKVLN